MNEKVSICCVVVDPVKVVKIQLITTYQLVFRLLVRLLLTL